MGNEVETLDYIPGSALRGMLAEAFLYTSRQPDTLFRRVFVDDVVCFPNLYPLVNEGTARPIPLSAYTCKSEPGFKNDKRRFDEPEEPHGVWDLLFEKCNEFTGREDRRCHKEDECAHAPLKPHEGFYNGSDPTPQTIQIASIISTRTAVQTKTQSALEASLHSQRELPAGTKFRGLLTATDEHALDALEKALGSPVIGYTGRRRAGKVTLILQPPSLQSPQPAFLEEWPLQERWSFFTLTLLSDTILVDRLLRPVVTLTSDILKDREQVDFPTEVSVCVVKAFCATRRVSGWHSIARIFKPDDIALVKGSTFLLKVPTEARELVQQWMSSVTANGIGLRKSEGFGRVCFDEPLHHLAAREKGGPL
jgi:CRISPR-associated protein Csx10